MLENFLMNHVVLLREWSYCIVSVVGILLALTRWKRHSNVSRLLLIACLFNIASVLVFSVVAFKPTLWNAWFYINSGYLSTGSGVVATGFFIAACLSQRPVKSESL